MVTKARYVTIANPNAGSHAANESDLSTLLSPLGPTEVWHTSSSESAAQLARRAALSKPSAIIVAGGDGTIHDVVNGAFDEQGTVGATPFLFLPFGTGNDLVRSLWGGQVPSPQEVINLATQGHSRSVDCIELRCQGAHEICLNTSVGGFGTVVNQKLEDVKKDFWGPFAYLLGAAKAVGEITEYRFTCTVDGAEHELPGINLVIANGRFVAGGRAIAPSASLTDGLADIIVFGPLSAAGLAIVASQVAMGTHLDHESVSHFRAAEFEIDVRPRLELNVDGELRLTSPLSGKVLPQALRTFSPLP